MTTWSAALLARWQHFFVGKGSSLQDILPAQEAPEIARQAVAIGAKVLWLQLGIVSEEARQIAEAAGLTVVTNRCMGATHRLLGLEPGPHASIGA